ncbi:HAD family hydrolase [Deltaproteobacteria bacterium OttesenSCG-928-K17]|nr:HAD family hydrolase [Deltaproteobacteria bacterium OttesenSCG-928-K17]
MVQTVIFDFDMTLVDSIYAITRGLNKMAAHFNLRQVDDSDTRRVMSLPPKDFWSTLWGPHDEAWTDYFLKHVAAEEGDYLEPAPGATDLLSRLRAEGKSLGLATNRHDAWGALASVGLGKYFDTAIGAGDVAEGKPAPDMLLAIMEQMQSDPGETVFIGDSVSDMQAAVRAGIRGAGVTDGGTSREDLLKAGAWQVRQNLSELSDFLCSPY